MKLKSAKQALPVVPNAVTSIFQMNKHGADFEIRLCEPNQRVIANYQQAAVTVDVFEFEGVGYLLSKFGDGGWNAAAFHASLCPAEFRGVADEFLEVAGPLDIFVLLCDERGHQEFGSRRVSLSRQVAMEIASLCKTQLANPINGRGFNARDRLATRIYTSSQMALAGNSQNPGAFDSSEFGD